MPVRHACFFPGLISLAYSTISMTSEQSSLFGSREVKFWLRDKIGSSLDSISNGKEMLPQHGREKQYQYTIGPVHLNSGGIED